jgi:hypothetical protein
MGRSWLKFGAKSAKGNPRNGALSVVWGEAIFGFDRIGQKRKKCPVWK